MKNNIFTNKSLYSYHFTIENAQRRLGDFKKMYDILEKHLKPQKVATINKDKINKYIELYKDENKDFIKRVLNSIYHINFDKFCLDINEQLEIFNSNIKDKKYIYIIGVNNDTGSSSNDFNIYKSNMWMFFLIYNKLKKHPVDIILNIKIAIQLYGDTVDYLIVDDCSYSGSQIVDNVLYDNASETQYKYQQSYLIKSDIYKKTIFKPIQKHNINVHLFIPYISFIAWDKIQELKLTTCYNIITYEKYIINDMITILSINDGNKLRELYSNFYNNIDPLQGMPIFFDHKIADAYSTLELILTKGQVLDNPDERLIFIDACDELYNKIPHKDIILKILYCPIPPYHFFEELLKKNLK